MYTDYASVAALSEPEQSHLLESGDAPERLWAAWSLALRHGRSALPTLATLAGVQLTDGLKRQLLVILAGLGARSILLTIATTEQSPDVRATATANYIRTSSINDTELIARFAQDQLHTGTAEVVLAVLAEQEMSRIELPEREVTACLDDPRLEIRQAAVSCLLAKEVVSDDAQDCLLRALVGEEEVFLRDRLLNYVPRPALPFLLRLLKDAPAARVVEILARLGQKFGLLPWFELCEISQVSEPSVVDAALCILDLPVPDEAIPWLGSLYQGARANPDRLWRDIQWRVGHSLRRSLTTENAHRLGAEAIGLFREEIEDDLAHFNSVSVEEREEYDYFEEDGVELVRLLSILSATEDRDRDERSPTRRCT